MTALLAFVVVSAPTSCTSTLGTELTVEQARARLEAARTFLEAEHESYRAWQAAWVTTLAVSVVGQGAVGNAAEERGRRAALLTGAFKAAVGLAAVLTMPESNPPGSWSGGVCAQLREAELALARLTRAQARGRRLWRYVGSVLFNLAATLFVGLVYDEWTLAITSGVIGGVVGQTILYTRPDNALETSSGGMTVGPGAVGLGWTWRF